MEHINHINVFWCHQLEERRRTQLNVAGWGNRNPKAACCPHQNGKTLLSVYQYQYSRPNPLRGSASFGKRDIGEKLRLDSGIDGRSDGANNHDDRRYPRVACVMFSNCIKPKLHEESWQKQNGVESQSK
jgi:hypothetical protein